MEKKDNDLLLTAIIIYCSVKELVSLFKCNLIFPVGGKNWKVQMSLLYL